MNVSESIHRLSMFSPFLQNDEGSAASWSMGLGDTIPLDLFLSTSGSFHSGWTPHTSRNENLELLVRLLPPQQRVFELTADAFNDGFVSYVFLLAASEWN